VGINREGEFDRDISYFNDIPEDFPVYRGNEDYNEIKDRVIKDYNRLKAEGKLEEFW